MLYIYIYIKKSVLNVHMIVVPNSGPEREFFFQWDIEVVFPKKANCNRHTRLSLSLDSECTVVTTQPHQSAGTSHFIKPCVSSAFCVLNQLHQQPYDGINGAVHTTTWAGPAPGLARVHTLPNLHLTAAFNSLLLYSQLQSGPDLDQKSDVIFPQNMSSVSIFPDGM